MKTFFRVALLFLFFAIHMQAADFQSDSAAKAKQDYLRSLQAALGDAIASNNSEEVNRISQEISRLSARPAGSKPQVAADKSTHAEPLSATPSEPGKIRVLEVEGTGSAAIDEQGRKQTIEQGLFLSQGTRIVTGLESSVVLAFENGSQVVVKPGSDFSVDKFLQNPFDSEDVDYRSRENEPTSSVTRTILQKGEIYFHVAKLSKNSSYQFVTPVGTAGIRGTGGFVRVGKTGAFGLYEGTAIFSTPNGQVLPINANQTIGIGDAASSYAVSNNPSGIDNTLAIANRQMAQVAKDLPPKPFEKGPLPERKPTPESIPTPESLIQDTALSSVTIAPKHPDFELESTPQGLVIKKYIGKYKKVVVPEQIAGQKVFAIGGTAFSGCKDLTEVFLPDTLEQIKAAAFLGCEGLTQIDLPKNLKEIGYNAFKACSGIKSIQIPESVQSIGGAAFAVCNSLKEIDVSEKNPYFSSMNGVLYSKSKDTLLCVPADYSSRTYKVPQSVQQIGEIAFQGDKLQKVFIYKDTKLHEHAFSKSFKAKVVNY